ncbi:MAG TPA: arginase [bacterium]|nr:arginase [bacterium]HMW32129.1 arginase [bacterium]HMZ03152.1 arginase [bacterium]HNB08832.1 arginase [bacterium]HNB57003.1 arginase [bacterium]
MSVIRLIGVPLDLGAGRRGTDMGPSALRLAGLTERLQELGHTVKDKGDIVTKNPEVIRVGDEKLKYLNEVTRAVTALADDVEKCLADNHIPLVLGGDHSIAIGTLAGVSGYFRKNNQKIGVIWIDAHGDMNTPDTSPSGNIHGMPLAVSLGHGHPKLTGVGGEFVKVNPENTVLVGIRTLDDGEIDNIRRMGVTVFTMRDIDEQGMSKIIRQAIDIAARDTAGIHVSFDADSMDPSIAPGVGTPVPGGLTYRETHLAMESLCDSKKVISAEIVETNPILDIKNTTAHVGVEMMASLFGKRIM